VVEIMGAVGLELTDAEWAKLDAAGR